MGLVMTLSIDIRLNSIEWHYAECRDFLNAMMYVVMLSVVSLNVIMLSVVAPKMPVFVLTSHEPFRLSLIGFKAVNRKSMFAVLHSDINSLKSGLLHLTGQPYCKRVDQQKSKMEI
jgi:hypothetical protein